MHTFWIKKTLKLQKIIESFVEKLWKLGLNADSIRFYDQDGKPASSDLMLRQIATKSPKTVVLEISEETTLEVIKSWFEDNYGVKFDILDPDGSPLRNEAVLDDIKKAKEERSKLTFDEDDVYIISSFTIDNKIIGSDRNGGPQLWIKCEKWEWGWVETEDAISGSDPWYTEHVFIFNRPGWFGSIQSDDGKKSGLREVNIACKKIKPDLLDGKGLRKITADDIEINQLSCTYDDVLANDFMMAGQFIFHQKHGVDEFGILGEKNPWSPHSPETNRNIFLAMKLSMDDEGEQREFGTVKAFEFGDDLEEQIESGQFEGKDLFRNWGRCEGTISEVLFGETEQPDFQGNYHMDCLQIIVLNLKNAQYSTSTT